MKTREQMQELTSDSTMRLLRMVEAKLAWALCEDSLFEPFTSVQFRKNCVDINRFERELSSTGWRFTKKEYVSTVLYHIGTPDDSIFDDNED